LQAAAAFNRDTGSIDTAIVVSRSMTHLPSTRCQQGKSRDTAADAACGPASPDIIKERLSSAPTRST
jgi:hypothetical protein